MTMTVLSADEAGITLIETPIDRNAGVKFGIRRVDDLDDDARVNIPRHMRQYWAYKASLIADGESAEDVESILRGFIWSYLEDCD